MKGLNEYLIENNIIITIQVLKSYSEAKFNGDLIGMWNHCLNLILRKLLHILGNNNASRPRPKIVAANTKRYKVNQTLSFQISLYELNLILR